MIIGIDMGKANIAAFDGLNQFICPSTFIEGVDKLDQGYQILFNGKKYLIGDQTITSDYDMTKEKLSHKLMMYMAIALHVKNDEHVTVVTNCPYDLWVNKQLRRSFKNFLSNNGDYETPVEITVGLSTKRFYIDEIVVVSETNGYCYSNPNEFTNTVAGIIDIGGGQRNHVLYDDLNIVRSHSFSEPDGMHFLRKTIRDSIKQKGLLVTDNEMKYIINDANHEYKFLVNEVVDNYVESIKRDITARKWGDGIKKIFIGGGSVELCEKIKEKIPNSTISEDALFDNCKGNYRMGVLLCEKSQN